MKKIIVNSVKFLDKSTFEIYNKKKDVLHSEKG